MPVVWWFRCACCSAAFLLPFCELKLCLLSHCLCMVVLCRWPAAAAVVCCSPAAHPGRAAADSAAAGTTGSSSSCRWAGCTGCRILCSVTCLNVCAALHWGRWEFRSVCTLHAAPFLLPQSCVMCVSWLAGCVRRAPCIGVICSLAASHSDAMRGTWCDLPNFTLGDCCLMR